MNTSRVTLVGSTALVLFLGIIGCCSPVRLTEDRLVGWTIAEENKEIYFAMSPWVFAANNLLMDSIHTRDWTTYLVAPGDSRAKLDSMRIKPVSVEFRRRGGKEYLVYSYSGGRFRWVGVFLEEGVVDFIETCLVMNAGGGLVQFGR